MTVETIAATIKGHRYQFTSEAELQEGIARVLGEELLECRREVALTPRDRIDFLAAGGIGVEIKTKGGATEVTRQLMRYAECPEIEALVLVTTRMQHGKIRGPALGGKPFTVVLIPTALR